MNNCYEVERREVPETDLPVYGIPDMDIVAVANNQRRNCRIFNMIDLSSGELLCQLRRNEYIGWLCKVASANDVPFNSVY